MTPNGHQVLATFRFAYDFSLIEVAVVEEGAEEPEDPDGLSAGGAEAASPGLLELLPDAPDFELLYRSAYQPPPLKLTAGA